MPDAIALLELSGTPCAVVGGRRVALTASDALLLAWLALEGPTPRERLAALLWPASSAEAARNALRQRLFRLRKQLGMDLVDGSLTLCLAAATTHDLGASGGSLLGRLSAPDAPELDAWLASRRAAQRGLSRQATEDRIQALEAAADLAAALPLAQALLAAEPLSEDAHRRVMRLHYLRGDRAAALLAFDRCEQLLKHEIGTVPTRQTLDLLATIERSGVVAGVAAGAAARGPLPAQVLRPPRLIGRDDALALLQRGLADGHVVVLVGEAGMGKSRLLQALAALQPGVLHASGRPGDSLVPYATLARALRQLLDRDPAAADPALRRALAPLLPELPEPTDGAAAQPAQHAHHTHPAHPEPGARHAPGAAGGQPAAAVQATHLQRQQLPIAQPVLALLQRAGRSVQTLALDDLHFADDATLDLLQSLLAAPRDSAGRAPGWCLGLRPAPPGSRLQGLLDALATAGPSTRLALPPLTEAQMAELVDSLALPGITGTTAITGGAGTTGTAGTTATNPTSAATIAGHLHQRTGGNPLFALETLKRAWGDGTLGLADGMAGLPRPDSLAQLIGQQLARLSAPALQLARVAAVAGVDFCIALAESLLQRSVLDLADAWAELEAQQVLRGEAFAHDLIHDAVLQGLPEVIARHLHGQTAAWLEAQAAADAGLEAAAAGAPAAAAAAADQRAVEPARVAAHWEAAGQRARALPALRAAAERAHRALREGERIAFLLRAADIAQAAERHDDAFALVRSAIEGHMNTIRQADGLPLLDRLQALARTPLQQARVAGDRAWYSTVLGDFDAAVSLGQQALLLALAAGDDGLAASIRQRLGTTLGMVGRFDDALPHLRAAEAWTCAHASADALCEFHGNLAVTLDNLGHPDEAQAHHQQALALSLAQGDMAQRATHLANYAGSRLDAGDLALASEQAAQAQRIVTTYDMAGSSAGYIAILQAQCDRAAGRYSAALQWCDRAEAILAERNPARVPVARLHRAHVWLDLGQHARALQLLGGAGLDSARAMPARYAVRWLLLLARAQRRLRQDVAPLLAQAAVLAPAAGWPELRLLVQTEQALQLHGQPALDLLQAVAQQARQRRLHGAELGALLHACAVAGQHRLGGAAALAAAALASAAGAEALHADRALRWLAPAQALAAGGAWEQAAALVATGRDWLRTVAAAHVAPEFADGFVHQHPLNNALLHWQPAP